MLLVAFVQRAENAQAGVSVECAFDSGAGHRSFVLRLDVNSPVHLKPREADKPQILNAEILEARL